MSTIGVVSSVPSGSEAATDGQISESDANVGLIAGLAVAVLLIIALVIAMVTIGAVAIALKKHVRDLSPSLPTSTNQAHGVTSQQEEIFGEENFYDYVEVVWNITEEKPLSSANTCISTEVNEAYGTNIVSSENEAYIATNITTDKNLTYGSFSKSEIEAELNDYYEN